MIYLDNAATTKVCREAADAAYYAMTEVFGNPSSLHRLGIEAEKLISFSKEIISGALGGQPSEIIFTSGATESNNLAISGLAENYGRRKKKIVTTAVEHPSVLEPMKRLAAKGYELTVVKPDENGEITEEALVSAVDGDTCLVSAMLVNNETGYVLPIERSFSRIKKLYPECLTHCDCVQGFMKLPIKVKSLSADAVSLSGHKIHAPKGVGALWIKKGVRVAPNVFGGGQQSGIRSGTEPVPLIYAFAKAVETLVPTLPQRYDHASEIRDYAVKKLSEAGALINSKSSASPYILSVSLPQIRSETLLHFLESRGIYVSSGSACSKGKKSEVLEAFRLLDGIIDSTVRISTSFETSKSDIDTLAEAFKEASTTLVKSTKIRRV